MRKLTIFIALFIISTTLISQTKLIKDADLVGNTNYTWSSDTIYVLDGFVFLEEGSTLNILAGTVIKGLESPSNSDGSSALIITRGAKINAIGNASQPIIFTSDLDDTQDDSDLDLTDRGLWGGLIILGNATITSNSNTEIAVEGIPEGEERALFGGSDDSDNSGILKYVSIRHGGAELAPGNEINGLTLGGVGSGTNIEFVEVFANQDDGIEFFGGTVQLKHLSVSFCGDDSYDYDEGFRGKGQFWFSLQGDDDGDNGGEHDGAKPDSGEPTSNPTIYNATYIGSGIGADAKNEHALLFRDGSAGTYANSIFTDFANFALQVEDRKASTGIDSRKRMEDGHLNLLNNVWFNFGAGSEINASGNGIINVANQSDGSSDAEDPNAQFLVDHLTNNNNVTTDPGLRSISRTIGSDLDPTPSSVGSAFGDLADTPQGDAFFTTTDFKGAFSADPSQNWLVGWTALHEYGLLVIEPQVPSGSKLIKDADLVGNTNYTWSSDTIYYLDGFVFLEEGSTLKIPAGTVIKGLESPSNSDGSSALIITRGAKINAIGNASNPIIFTSDLDDTQDNSDLDLTDRGLWGGLIILGNATITSNSNTEIAVEGIPEGEERALFGGSDDSDNSGILKYVSIRHGGAELAPGNEINGLTLGGVGSGTNIEFVEVFANQDDGIEFFGGTVQLKHLSVSFCGDDSYDYDEGFRGKGQFWFSLQGDDDGDNGGEHDGAKPDSGEPTSNPTIYNATYIGAGIGADAKNEHALLFRDGSAGTYANSIFTDFANFALQVEDRKASTGVDSRKRMEDGHLNLLNNVWFNFGAGSEINASGNGIINVANQSDGSSDAEDPNAQFLVDHLTNNNNVTTDPGLRSISRTIGSDLDPTPSSVGSAFGDLADTPQGDAFFTTTDFKGAFSADPTQNWLTGWTALHEYGLLVIGATTSIKQKEFNPENLVLKQNYPNPFANETIIDFQVKKSTSARFEIFSLNGQHIQTVFNKELRPGNHTVLVSSAQLTSGTYLYRLVTNKSVITKKMNVLKN